MDRGCLAGSHRRMPWSVKSLGEQIDLQGHPPQCTRAVCSTALEIKQTWQRASVKEHRAPDGALMQKM